VLGGGKDGASLLQTTGGVEQAEQDASRTDTDEIVEIARHAAAVVDRRQFGPVEFRDVRMDRIADGNTQRFFKMEESARRKSSREATTEFGQEPINKMRSRCAHQVRDRQERTGFQWKSKSKGLCRELISARPAS
jgi:hypothetical protein